MARYIQISPARDLTKRPTTKLEAVRPDSAVDDDEPTRRVPLACLLAAALDARAAEEAP